MTPRLVLRAISKFAQRSESRRQYWLRKQSKRRFPLDVARSIADDLVRGLISNSDVLHCSVAGSVRRGEHQVRDIDLVAASNDPQSVVETFFSLVPEATATRKWKQSKNSAHIIGPEGIAVALRIVSPELYGIALLIFTGPRAFNNVVYRRALKRLSLKDRLIFRTVHGGMGHSKTGDVSATNLIKILSHLVGSEHIKRDQELREVDVFHTLGHVWLEPTQRTVRDAIEAFQGESESLPR
jgi:DNA polymerase (family 10)